jgi:hypothetical protein
VTRDQPTLTATVEVIRSRADVRGIIEDLALRGETHIRVEPADPSLVVFDPVVDLGVDTRGALGVRDVRAYTLASIMALRGGFYPVGRLGSQPSQIPGY